MDYPNTRTALGWSVALTPVAWILVAFAFGGSLYGAWFLLVPFPAVWVILISIAVAAGNVSPSDHDPNVTCVMGTDANGPIAYGVKGPWHRVFGRMVAGRAIGGGVVLATGVLGWLSSSWALLLASTLLALVVGGWQLLRLVGLAAEVVFHETMDSVGEVARAATTAATGSEEAGDAAAEVARGVARDAIIGGVLGGIDVGE